MAISEHDGIYKRKLEMAISVHDGMIISVLCTCRSQYKLNGTNVTKQYSDT